VSPPVRVYSDMEREGPLTVITAGGRWKDAQGNLYVVTWVRRIGVVAFRREGPGDQTELVSDVVRFVRAFAPAGADPGPANRAAAC
jgi:hypothetical protein